MASRISHLGVAWKFPIRANEEGRIATTDDLGSGSTSEEGEIEHIIQSISMIVGTKQYERIYLPDFYGGVYDILFEPMNDFVDGIAESIFFDNVSRLELRITILGTFTVRDPELGKLQLGIRFRLDKTNIQGSGLIE
jgi:phage baseplate assembly protein W